jgi:nicotinic acid mononucleotide adenylyltransferase
VPVVLPTDQHPLVRYHQGQSAEAMTSAGSVAVLPGSFNPLHRGHLKLKQVAERVLQIPVVFELSLHNADKESLSDVTVNERLSQFTSETVYLSRASLFSQKAALFPACTFVVGLDTAERILNPRFYGFDRTRMLSSLLELAELGHRFLVGGRLQNAESASESQFCTLEDMFIPTELTQLFKQIPASMFREDVSSTQLRQQASRD